MSGGNTPLKSSEQIRELWSTTYNTEGKPDWSHLFPCYREDIEFRDSVQAISGKKEFEAMCLRLAGRCKALRMDILALVMDGGTVFMQWEMTMSFKKFPSATLFGSTRLLLDEAGLIYDQRDYYDLWGDIFDNIPWMAKPYRRFMRKRFG
jgi:hypothetical protein